MKEYSTFAAERFSVSNECSSIFYSTAFVGYNTVFTLSVRHYLQVYVNFWLKLLYISIQWVLKLIFFKFIKFLSISYSFLEPCSIFSRDWNGSLSSKQGRKKHKAIIQFTDNAWIFQMCYLQKVSRSKMTILIVCCPYSNNKQSEIAEGRP